MSIVFGTANGVWKVDGDKPEPIGLTSKYVSHVMTSNGYTLAAAPNDGLYALSEAGERRIWEGDARSCAIGHDGKLYLGIEPAMIFRSEDSGETWQRLDKIDELPTRDKWYFPPPPHEPHVRSIDFLPGEPTSVLAGVEVGGVLLSLDFGDTWKEMNNGVNVDVHTVRPDPSQPGRLMAVTGGGIYASEDGGESWEKRETGIGQGYAVGLHFNPHRSGEVLVATGQRPPGLNAQVYHSLDAGRSWHRLSSDTLPSEYDRVPVMLFTEDAAWLATDKGQVFKADLPLRDGKWSLVCEIPAAINAASAGGSPSSIDSGFRG